MNVFMQQERGVRSCNERKPTQFLFIHLLLISGRVFFRAAAGGGASV